MSPLFKSAYYVSLSLSCLTGFHDTSDGADPHVHWTHSHVSHTPVLSGPQVEHPASEVGLLEQQPVALHHVSRLAFGHAVTVLDRIAVVHQLIHLTTEVLPLVDLHPELASVL